MIRICLLFISLPIFLWAKPSIVLVAGKDSHGKGAHEFSAGCNLLAAKLRASGLANCTVIFEESWPKTNDVFESADSIIFYGDGHHKHLLNTDERFAYFDRLAKKGTGIGVLHYACEVFKEKGTYAMDWVGGYYERGWSTNPTWSFDAILKDGHPTTNGVKSFNVKDEWYFNMRFTDKNGLVHVLQGIPDKKARSKKGEHGGPHITNRAGKPETVLWAFERPSGGRGFGFTGGHFHNNWKHDDFRKLVLNSILWSAGGNVPKSGVASTTPTAAEMALPQPKANASTPKPVAKTRPATAASVAVVKAWPKKTLVKPLGGTVNYTTVSSTPRNRTRGQIYHLANDVSIDGIVVEIAQATARKTPLSLSLYHGVKHPREVLSTYAVNLPNNLKKGALVHISFPSQAVPAGYLGCLFEAASSEAEIKLAQVSGKTAGQALWVEDEQWIRPELGLRTALLGTAAKQPVLRAQQIAGSRGKKKSIEAPAVAAQETPKPTAPKVELAVHDGLEARLFAKEPMVMAPTQVVADQRGRIWVSEAVNYRNDKRRPAGDRIVILEDKDGDGQADHSTVFYQGKDLNGVMGICVLENKVIVSNAPEIFVLEDLDGDDKADKKTVLFTGIGGKQHDHSVHAVAVGPDGKYYFGMGDHGKGMKTPNGKPAVDVHGRNPFDLPKGKAFRCDPNGSNLEIIGYNFRNPYELAVDSFGRVWQSDNDNGGSPACRLNHVIGWGNYGYSARARSNGPRTNASPRAEVAHWYQNDPGTIPNLTLVGTGAPTGLCFYEGTLLPKSIQGAPILCEHAQNIVRAFQLKAHGAGYETSYANVLRGNVSWFRPSDVCVANDGSLFVSDWHDPASGGHRALSSATGRIYRVAPAGHAYKPTAADLTTTAGQVAAFASPNPVTWAVAAARLRKANAEAAVRPLLKSADSAIRARAAYLLTGNPQTASMAEAGLADIDERVRAAAVRAAATAKSGGLVKLLVTAAQDKSAQVRREVALALTALKPVEAQRLWVALAQQHKAGDRMMLESLGTVADGNWDAYLDAWLAVADWDTPSGHDLLWRAKSKTVLPYYVKIISNPDLQLSSTLRFFRAFDFQEVDDKYLLELLSVNHPDTEEIATYALKHLRKTPASNPQVKHAVERLLKSRAGTSSYLTLVQRYNMKDKAPEILALALKNTSNQLGYDAVHVLAGFKKLDLLDQAYDAAENKSPIISLIGNSRDEKAAKLLMPRVLDTKNDLALRRQMMEALKHTSTGARGIMPIIINGKFPKDLEDEALTMLAGCVYANVVDWAVGELAARNGGKEPLSLNKLLAMQGHADAGEKIFDTYCMICHKMDNRGIDFGPNLTTVGNKLGRFAMYDAILNPGAGVEFNYETTEVTLKDGGVLIGMTQTESNADVTLKLMGGQTKVVARADIKKLRRLPGSLMPAGIARGLAPQQLADLVEYLGKKK